ncbi:MULTISPECIES: post-transcriptional regulator [Listeria]|uniref:post-transcriptional regulator n=1 Tax=Listeria TaxID=1637 RepID=UPI000B58A598|nr:MULTISPECIES: post-transcriptional regulator [Listeria]
MSHEDWYESLEPAILIKVEDFHLLSYREIKPEHIWSFLTEVKWATNPTPNLHERVNDIMQMNIGQLMDFITKTSNEPAISASANNETENLEDNEATSSELSK